MNIKAWGTAAKAIPPQLRCRRRRIQHISGKVGIHVAQKSPEAQRSVDLIPLSLPQGPAGFCSTENPVFCTGAKAVQTPNAKSAAVKSACRSTIMASGICQFSQLNQVGDFQQPCTEQLRGLFDHIIPVNNILQASQRLNLFHA
jgi:hypothetical protein